MGELTNQSDMRYKIQSLAFLIMMTVLLSGCIFNRSSESAKTTNNVITASSITDAVHTSSATTGVSTTITSLDENHQMVHEMIDSPIDVTLAFMDVLCSLENFNSYTTSLVTCKKGIISYTQNTDVKSAMANGIYYDRTNSSSMFVKIDNLKVFSQTEVKVTDKDGITSTPIGEYEEKYGYTPFSKLLGGYIVDESTIESVSIDPLDDGTYKISLSLFGDKAGAYAGIEMKEMSNMGSYPKYETLIFEIFINDDFTPIRWSLDSQFTADLPVLGNSSCIQKLDVRYENINGDIIVPTF